MTINHGSNSWKLGQQVHGIFIEVLPILWFGHFALVIGREEFRVFLEEE
jgi:hypothetical protein